MKKLIIYCFLLTFGAFSACEDIYTPTIEKRENVIVADARIVVGKEDNYIRLNKSLSYSVNSTGYPVIAGARVSIVDNSGNEMILPETEDGVFHVNFQVNFDLGYKIIINYDGNTYESDFESVPEIPEMDSVYGIEETKIIIRGGVVSVDDFWEKLGLQMYMDIATETESPYYRFTARKILQTIFIENPETINEIYHYKWETYLPTETFNIASSPEYSSSKSIKKHPLFFMERRSGIEKDTYFAGWILILYQHGLTKSAYNYYKDLNNQLNSEGRLFDPMYVQARNNLKCTNNAEQLILGNFEISTQKEYRYFVKFISEKLGYKIKPIDEFYEIPWSGDMLVYPEFWEH